MPEEGIETQELKENLDDAREKADGEGGGRAPWLTWLSLSTAHHRRARRDRVARVRRSRERGNRPQDGRHADPVRGGRRVGGTTRPSRSRKTCTARSGRLRPRPEVAAEWTKKANEEHAQKDEQKAEAEKLVAEVKAADAESRHHLELHHQFAKSVTIFQVAIALAAIAALARKKSLWWVSLAVGAIGAVFLARGFFPF